MVIDGLLAGAHGADQQVRGVRVLPLPHRLSLACPGPAASGGALLCRGWPPSMLSRTRRTGLPAKPDWYPREGAADAEGGWVETAGSPDLYDAEVRAAGPAGTVAAWAPGTFYRGTALDLAPRRPLHEPPRLPAGPCRVGPADGLGRPQPRTRVVPVRAPGDTTAAGALRLPARSPVLDRSHLRRHGPTVPGLTMTRWQQALRGEA